MDVINCLKSRRSIRSYKSDPIPQNILRKILETACYAPSSKNTQPWEFYILTGKEKDYICDLVVKEYPKRGKPFRKRNEDFRKTTNMTNIASTVFIRQAPVLILVFNKAPYTAGEKNIIKEISETALWAYSVEIQSVAAFIFSILLAAHSLGIGGCWVADINFCRNKIKKYIGTKNDLVAGVVLGYPQTLVPPKKIILEKEKLKYWKK